MRIVKEGYRTITNSMIMLIIIGILINYYSHVQDAVHIIYYILSIIVLIWIIGFFRLPKRKLQINDNNIISSADGKVVAIEEVFENEYYNDKRLQVSVFMSPFNIHANWYPVSGKIIYTKYQTGKHFIAFRPKSSLSNEMTTTVIETSNQKSVLVRQIAGALARRVVCYARRDAEIKQGEQLGFIKLGSRVDLLLPLNAEIKVSLNQKVKGSQTIIAEI